MIFILGGRDIQLVATCAAIASNASGSDWFPNGPSTSAGPDATADYLLTKSLADVETKERLYDQQRTLPRAKL
jgi:hypothetical protein